MLNVCYLFNLYQNYNSLDRSSSSSMPSPSSSLIMGFLGQTYFPSSLQARSAPSLNSQIFIA